MFITESTKKIKSFLYKYEKTGVYKKK